MGRISSAHFAEIGDEVVINSLRVKPFAFGVPVFVGCDKGGKVFRRAANALKVVELDVGVKAFFCPTLENAGMELGIVGGAGRCGSVDVFRLSSADADL